MVLDLEFLSKPEIMWRFVDTGRGGGNTVPRKIKTPQKLVLSDLYKFDQA